jgi:4-amino-4-deoxy-L-arabinose transferase-like glycosyltransferase
VIVVLQYLSDMTVGLMIYWLAGLICSPLAGFLAATVWVLYPPSIAASSTYAAEPLFAAFILFAIVALVKSWNGSAMSWSIVAGLSLGIATLIRGNSLYLCVFMLPIWLWQKHYKQMIAFVAMIAVVLPWTIRNVVVLDDWLIVQSSYGASALQGSDEKYFTIEGKRREYPRLYRESIAAGLARPTSGKERDMQSWLTRILIRNYELRLRNRPFSFFPFLASKLIRIWYATESGNFRTELVLALCSLVIVPAAIIQLWNWRRIRAVSALLIPMLLYFIGCDMITAPIARYMFPIYTILILAAASFSSGLIVRQTAPKTEPALAISHG